MNKNQKTDLISNVKEKLTSHSYIAIIHYRGMSEKELYNLRVDLKAKGCGIKIAKNTLVKERKSKMKIFVRMLKTTIVFIMNF